MITHFNYDKFTKCLYSNVNGKWSQRKKKLKNRRNSKEKHEHEHCIKVLKQQVYSRWILFCVFIWWIFMFNYFFSLNLLLLLLLLFLDNLTVDVRNVQKNQTSFSSQANPNWRKIREMQWCMMWERNFRIKKFFRCLYFPLWKMQSEFQVWTNEKKIITIEQIFCCRIPLWCVCIIVNVIWFALAQSKCYCFLLLFSSYWWFPVQWNRLQRSNTL